MLKIYYAEISELDPYCDLSAFSEYRRGKLETVSNERQRQQEICAELLLKQALLDIRPDFPLPPRISRGKYDKPCIVDSDINFSLSHSGELSVCAVSDKEIGVDIQRRRPFSEAFVKRFFAPSELEEIQGAKDRDEAFTKLWALKESYLKAIGTGLNTSLRSFELSLKGHIKGSFEDCGFWQERAGEYYISLCVLNDSAPKPEVFKKIKLL